MAVWHGFSGEFLYNLGIFHVFATFIPFIQLGE